MSETLPREFGRFRLIEKLGVGGMGEVFLAKISGPDQFEREVAIKLILPRLSSDATFRDLFSREARLAAALHHPNIVSVYEYGRIGETDFLLMEYVKGTDLRSLIKRLEGSEMMPRKAAYLVIHRIARGIDYAHSTEGTSGAGTSIIHQDLSPHNVLISTVGEVKIADFGIARAVTDDPGARSALMGKASYMSPEQVEGKVPDKSSDLFSLGTIACQLLSGKHPFLASTRESTMEAVSVARHVSLSELSPDLPEAVSAAVERLLARAPQDRPENTDELISALEPHLEANADRLLGKLAEAKKPLTARELTSLTAPTLVNAVRRSLPLAAGGILLLLGLSAYLLWPSAAVKVPGDPSISSSGKPSSKATVSTPRQITIVTDPPGAEISVDGNAAGLSPATLETRVTGGPLRIKAGMYGYEPAEFTLDPAAGGPVRTVILVPLPVGSVPVSAAPWARVYFNNKLMGTTPLILQGIPTGTRDLKFSNEVLGIDKTVTIKVSEGKNDPVVVRMGD